MSPNRQGHKEHSSVTCSAMVKLLPNYRDLYFAHDTWNHYSSMLRVLKSYDFAYHVVPSSKEKVPGQKITFSSYPGILQSIDDFYLISSGLAVMETTNSNYNVKVAMENIMPRGGVLTGVRVMAANRLSRDIHAWADTFSTYNSGTYNNMWMVLDFTKFTPNTEPRDTDLFLVLEQMPGYIMYEDKTKELKRRSYWGSYNVPYFTNIEKLSGQTKLIEKYGDFFSYWSNPRAKIMRREQRRVTGMDSMIRLMRSNNYEDDPLASCPCKPTHNADLVISARSDLNPENGVYSLPHLGHRPHGAIDMKLTNSSLFKKLEFVAISGPTSDNVPPFQWSTAGFDKVSHVGQPDLFDFRPYIFGDQVIPYRWTEAVEVGGGGGGGKGGGGGRSTEAEAAGAAGAEGGGGGGGGKEEEEGEEKKKKTKKKKKKKRKKKGGGGERTTHVTRKAGVGGGRGGGKVVTSGRRDDDDDYYYVGQWVPDVRGGGGGGSGGSVGQKTRKKCPPSWPLSLRQLIRSHREPFC